jgi:hypothetical protein
MITALANVGIPMIFPQLFLMCIVFVPVVLIESVIAAKSINIPFIRVAKDVSLANLITTIIGVPIAWVFMLFIDGVFTGGVMYKLNNLTEQILAVTLQAAWLAPYEGQLRWMIPAAATVLLIPSFIVSLIIEYLILAIRWKDKDRSAVFQVVLRANIWSYLCLFVVGCIMIMINAR